MGGFYGCQWHTGLCPQQSTPRMQALFAVFTVLSVAKAATIPPPPMVSWRVEDAVDFFNKGSNQDYIFKLVEVDPQYDLDEPASTLQLQFMVKETECLKSENKTIEECNFQEHGAIKVCSAVFLVDPERNGIVVTCESFVTESSRVRRSSWSYRRRHNRTYYRPRPNSYTNIVNRRRPNTNGNTGLIYV
ncbi:cathelicidin-1-like [Lissotriton helveticus]